MSRKSNLFSSGGLTESQRSIHTPSDFARQNLLYVQEVGTLKSLAPHRCVREKLESFLFVVVLSGRGNFYVSGRHYEVQAGDCIFLNCMEHYEHISSEGDAWELAWVHFNGKAARSYYDLFLKYNSSNVFNTPDTDKWVALIEEMLEKQDDRKLLAEMRCGELLLGLCNQVVESIVNADIMAEEENKKLANDIREYVNDEYAAPTVLEDVEMRFRTPLNVVDSIFNRYFGICLDEYVWNRRFGAAKELLRFSIKSVQEIVEESGIGDIVTMQRLFRENENVSAEEYRMKWAQWIK